MYKLDSRFTSGHFTVTVIGCGGTGGFAAEGICRLLPKNADMILIDHDRVEERNLNRQNFSHEDLGKFKSEALARRLARRYGRPVAYSTYSVSLADIKAPGLVIGCVDNGLARRKIEEKVKSILCPPYGFISWWVDAGNDYNYGQVFIGNHKQAGFFDQDKGICHALPLPTIQMPALLAQAPPQEQDCVQIAEQGPTINQAIAALVVEVVRRLIEGTCSWMQLYLDLDSGTLVPIMATPEAVEKITGIKRRNLERR